MTVPREVIQILSLAKIAGLELDPIESRILAEGGVHA
jgi:hypothetical protein